MATDWTQEMKADLKRLRKDGDSFGLIASTLSEKYGIKISKGACIGKARRMGIASNAVHGYPVGSKRLKRKDKPVLKNDTTIMDLKSNQCRFVKSGSGLDAKFCGKLKENDSVYCSEHKQRCYEWWPGKIAGAR